MLQALEITVVGMLIVFACLGLLLLIMMGIGRLLKPKQKSNQVGRQ